MSKWIQIRVVSDDEPAPTGESAAAWPAALGGAAIALALVVVAVWFFAFRGPRQPALVASRPGEVVPLPASQLAVPAAPLSGGAVDEPPAEAVSAEVARRLTSEQRVALVNGEPITEAMLEREVGIARVLYPLRGVPVGNDAQTLARMRSDILSSMIDERLLVLAAAEAGVVVADAEVDGRLDNLVGGIGLGLDDLADQLSSVGVSLDDLRASLHATMVAERFVVENPPPADVTAESPYAAWVKVLQTEGDVQVLMGGDASKTVKIGQPAPAFTLRDPLGEAISLADFAGQPVIVNFWATWCPPCRFEMPLLQQTYDKYRDDGLVVLAVDVQEGPELVIPYLEEMSLTFPVALDRSGAVANTYRVAGLPTTVFVDANGIVTDIHRGALVESTLQRYLTNILH